MEMKWAVHSRKESVANGLELELRIVDAAKPNAYGGLWFLNGNAHPEVKNLQVGQCVTVIVDAVCGATKDPGFTCTKAFGHDADHLAIGTDGTVYARWPQADAAPEPHSTSCTCERCCAEAAETPVLAAEPF